MKVYNFDEDLKKSQDDQDLLFWEEIYKQFFPLFARMEKCTDRSKQNNGVDRYIYEKGDIDEYKIPIEEKLHYSKYPNFIMERWSNVEKKIPGWVQKNLDCEYVAYAFILERRCFLIRFDALRATWKGYGREWIREFGTRRAPNIDYETEFVPVPQNVFLDVVPLVREALW